MLQSIRGAVRALAAVIAALTLAFSVSIAAAEPGTATGSAPEAAFNSAKELGTVEAWNAFLANYPSGFHSDLARAYLKKLSEKALSPAPTTAPAPSPAAVPFDDFPQVAGSWGGVVREGPGQQYRQLDSLAEGESVTLMARTEVFENGFPWFKIAFRDGQIGYKWGGILCSIGTERPDLYKTCPAAPPRRTESRNEEKPEPRAETKREPEGCGSGRVRIDGKCVKKRDASTYCGPGYRLKGNKCVAGYQAPKPQKQLPSWQEEAIKKGCPKGMDWNAAEGCHEND